MMRWCLSLAVLAVAVPGAGACCSGCFSTLRPPTFRQEAKSSARVIVFGPIGNPRRDGEAGFTDFYIEKTLRPDPVLKGRTSLVLEHFLPVEKKNDPPRLVIFCDIQNGKVDPYRGFVVQRLASVEYVKKAIALGSSDPVRNIVFFFEYLDDPDPAVSGDASQELYLADDFAIGAAGRELGAGKIRKRLDDPKTPTSHLPLYAKLLAAAGNAKDASRLLAVLEGDPSEAPGDLAPLLVAYTMLAPKDGWAYSMAILRNPAGSFVRRFAALRAVRFLAASRTGVVSNRQLAGAYRLLLTQDDMADLAIDDLRRAKRWDLADEILGLARTGVNKQPMVRRALLRYALQCEGNTAAAYVLARSKDAPETVADARKALAEEAADAKKCAESPKK